MTEEVVAHQLLVRALDRRPSLQTHPLFRWQVPSRGERKHSKWDGREMSDENVSMKGWRWDYIENSSRRWMGRNLLFFQLASHSSFVMRMSSYSTPAYANIWRTGCNEKMKLAQKVIRNTHLCNRARREVVKLVVNHCWTLEKYPIKEIAKIWTSGEITAKIELWDTLNFDGALLILARMMIVRFCPRSIRPRVLFIENRAKSRERRQWKRSFSYVQERDLWSRPNSRKTREKYDLSTLLRVGQRDGMGRVLPE